MLFHDDEIEHWACVFLARNCVAYGSAREPQAVRPLRIISHVIIIHSFATMSSRTGETRFQALWRRNFKWAARKLLYISLLRVILTSRCQWSVNRPTRPPKMRCNLTKQHVFVTVPWHLCTDPSLRMNCSRSLEQTVRSSRGGSVGHIGRLPRGITAVVVMDQRLLC